ncbi:MAG: nucleotidyltransferase domain-containing protein [Candidatus Micrarchaeota archaeon]
MPDRRLGIPEADQRRALRDLETKRFPLRGFTTSEDIRHASGILRKSAALLRKKIGDRFIGFALIGSRSKGTAVPGSDIDFRVIGEGLSKREVKLARDIVYEYANFGPNPLGKAIRIAVKNKPLSKWVHRRIFPFSLLEKRFIHRYEHLDAAEIPNYFKAGDYEKLADFFASTIGPRNRIGAARESLIAYLNAMGKAERDEAKRRIAEEYSRNRLMPSEKGLSRFGLIGQLEIKGCLDKRRKDFELKLE